MRRALDDSGAGAGGSQRPDCATASRAPASRARAQRRAGPRPRQSRRAVLARSRPASSGLVGARSPAIVRSSASSSPPPWPAGMPRRTSPAPRARSRRPPTASPPFASSFSSSAFDRKPSSISTAGMWAPRQDAHRRLHGGPREQRHVACRPMPREHRAERRGLIDERQLREVPRHGLDDARSAADDRHARLAGVRAGSRAAGGASTAGVKICAPRASGRTDQFACRLRNTSALLLFASSVRRSSVTVSSPSRVSSTRRPSRLSIAALQTARHLQRQVLFLRAARADRAGVVAAVAWHRSRSCAVPAGAGRVGRRWWRARWRRRSAGAGVGGGGGGGGGAGSNSIVSEPAGAVVVLLRYAAWRAEVDDEIRAVDARALARIPE